MKDINSISLLEKFQMKGKSKFTNEELTILRKLVGQFERANDQQARKTIRRKMRNLDFFVSDFGIQSITLSQFNRLFPAGKTVNPKTTLENTKSTAQNRIVKSSSSNKSQELIIDDFQIYPKLSVTTLSKHGFYIIQLQVGSKLPLRYQTILEERSNRILYIGKAQGQTLEKRLSQEIEHTSPGTFFRSIGAVLGKKPIKGHLIGKSNQNNYKFPHKETQEIIQWLLKNIEIKLIGNALNFDIEEVLIKDYLPLLNDQHNPLKLLELKEDKAYCRRIARGEKHSQ